MLKMPQKSSSKRMAKPLHSSFIWLGWSKYNPFLKGHIPGHQPNCLQQSLLLTLCLYANEIRPNFFFLKVIWVCQKWFILPKCYFFLRPLECIVWGNKIFLQNKANEFHVMNHFQMFSLLHFSRTMIC